MTQEKYFEMCEMLGEEPDSNNIPIELSDFADIVQVAFDVYYSLQDNWDSIGGNYLGKIKYNLVETMQLLGVEKEDYREIFTYINLIDRARSELIQQEKQQEKALDK